MDSNYCHQNPTNCASGTFFVSFHRHFFKIPNVVIGLSLLDIQNTHNTRVRIKTKAITTNGFRISFEPWGNGIAFQMGVHWMACPWRRTSIQALYNFSSNLNYICMLSLKYFFHLKCLWCSFVFNINKKALFSLIRP